MRMLSMLSRCAHKITFGGSRFYVNAPALDVLFCTNHERFHAHFARQPLCTALAAEPARSKTGLGQRPLQEENN